MATWTCAKCGVTTDDDRSICRACGAARRSLADARRPAVTPAASPPAPPPPPPESATSFHAPDEAQDRRTPDELDERDDGTPSREPWACVRCHTTVEGSFDTCWRCGASRTGEEDPSFRPIDDDAIAPPGASPLSAAGVNADPDPDPDPDRKPPGEPPARKCPACGETLVPIRLIDSSGEYGLRQRELRYAPGDARPGWFSGYPIEGVIRAQLCPGCGRVGLYAVAKP